MAEFARGDEFGDYRLEEPLGGGGFGDVWRARHVDSGEVVALKFLGGQYSEADTARINAEVELLATAAARSSRHVVRVLDGGTEPVPYVVMEYIAGGDLRAELAEHGTLSIEATLEVARGVLDALRVLNEAGIIHRDIKPANVMRDADGSVKLTDFGIAKIIGYDTITATGQLPLSMAYAAPESWDGRSSHRSDLYSVGILLYQCLVGEPPFGGTYAEVYRQHLSTRPDLTRLPTATPPSLRSLIARCLEKDVEARPADAGVCMQLVDAAASELEESTDPRGPRHPTRLGPWVIIDHHQTRAWTFRCQHEDTGREATVEVHSAPDLELGATLQRAVELSAELAPLGAETLLDTNRLVLRPGEAWPERTSGRFQFWVARDERPLRPEPEVGLGALRMAARTLIALREGVIEAGLPFAPAASDLLWSGGALHVRRVGLPVANSADESSALAALSTWPLTADARAALEAARSLEDLAGGAGAAPLLDPPPGSSVGSTPLRWAAGGLALLAGGILVAAVLFLALDSGSDGGGVVTPTATGSPTEVVEPTGEPTSGPAPGFVVQDDFSGGATDWTLTGSAALDDGTLVLTTPRGDEQGIAWLRAPVEGPFVAEFDYRAGGALDSIGGHGLVFMFYKRAADVGLGSGCLGFSAGTPCDVPGSETSGTLEGYGVEFDGHLNGIGQFPGFDGDPSAAHVALVADSAGQHLAYADDPRVEDNGWHHVRVTVALGQVTVEVDDETVLTWTGELDRTFSGLGFAATTTAFETNWHIIDNVSVEVTGPAPPRPSAMPSSRGMVLPPQLAARSCDLEATPPSAEQGASVWVEFSNETGEQSLTYEVTSAGLLLLLRLEPGERALHAGAVGDRWLVTDARGDCRAAFEAAATPPEPSGVWLARITEPAGTRAYRNQRLGFQFLRPEDELVQVLSGAGPGISALSMGERIELFAVSARGASVEEYAAGALTNARVANELQTSIDGQPAVVLEYAIDSGPATAAAAFVVRNDVAHVLTFARGDTVEGCSADLATYRMLLSTFSFLGDPQRAPTQLASPEIDASESLCGAVVSPPSGAEELTDLVASIGCGPLAVGIGDAVVCVPGLSDVATLMCWTVAGEPRDCAAGPSSLTTSFDSAGYHPIELTACTAGGCQTSNVRVTVGAPAPPRPPEVISAGCSPLYPRPGAPVTCVPEVSDDAVEYCWSADGALLLGESAAVERCSSSADTEFQAAQSGTALVRLRACNVEGLCGAAVQVLPIDSSVASFTFLPVAGCGVPAVLAGEALPCDEPAPPLPVGEHLVPVTVCLPAAPFQPTVCATADTTILVARTLAQGAIVDDGAGVEGARVDLLLVSGEQTPLVRRALTGVGGAYAFVDPPLGRYRVVVSTEEDGVWTERATFELEIAAEGRTDVESVDLAP